MELSVMITKPAKALVLVLFLLPLSIVDQENKDKEDHSYRPLTIKLNDSGSKYMGFIIWNPLWTNTNNLAVEDSKLPLSTSLRRSRVLAETTVLPIRDLCIRE